MIGLLNFLPFFIILSAFVNVCETVRGMAPFVANPVVPAHGGVPPIHAAAASLHQQLAAQNIKLPNQGSVVGTMKNNKKEAIKGKKQQSGDEANEKSKNHKNKHRENEKTSTPKKGFGTPKKGFGTPKKGIKVGRKLQQQQLKELKERKTKHLNEKKEEDENEVDEKKGGRLKLFLFWAFMLFNLIVPQMPQNLMIQRNNQFVPIEYEYLSCQPFGNGYQQCQFSVDQIAVDKDMSELSIWADLDGDSSTIEMLGKQDFRQCEQEDDENAFCSSLIQLNPEQIEKLPKIPIADTKIAEIEQKEDAQTKLPQMPIADTKIAKKEQKEDTQTNNKKGTDAKRRELADGGLVTFTLVNQCSHKIYVTGASQGKNIIPQQALDAGTQVDVTVPAAISSARLWPETDCDQKTCGDTQAPPTVSLFEWTFDQFGQTYDLSYVDAANLPMSVYTAKCPEKTVLYANNMGNSIDNLWTAVPGPMKATDEFGRKFVKSACQAYGTPETCCSDDHNQPTTCGPVYADQKLVNSNGMTDEQISGLGAMQSAFPTSYSYAYDDKRATQVCQGADHFLIGFCSNCPGGSCSMPTQ